MADAPEPILGPVRVRDKNTGNEYTVGVLYPEDIDKVEVLTDVEAATSDGRWVPPVYPEPKPVEDLSVPELRELAQKSGVDVPAGAKKADLLAAVAPKES